MTSLPKKYALISVSDKSDLLPFAQALTARNFTLVSTGGTARALAAANLPVTPVETVTGFPEILDGRVKTLHPKIHGGLLADRHRATHRAALETHDLPRFELLVLNLYPFADTLASGAEAQTCLENIDIGGPAMLRAAAKNHAHVLPIIAADQFPEVLAALDGDGPDPLKALRRPYAARAYDHTAQYDRLVADWLAGGETRSLRYGENPHQRAELILPRAATQNCAAHGQLHQGKALSYNNLLDADAAWELCQDLAAQAPDHPLAVIVKHTNPCGVARGETVQAALTRAKACDPVSAFGGILAVSHPLNHAAATVILQDFAEVVMAPEITPAARDLFATKPNLRLIEVPHADRPEDSWAYRSIGGGVLRQSFDHARLGVDQIKVVTKCDLPDGALADLLLAFTVAKHTKSNAIVLAHEGQILGVGAGQMSRVDAAQLARWKAAAAGFDTAGCVVASDAFFPFADGLHVAIEAGARAVIQPGGSRQDAEVIAAADAAGLAMAFTGIRHFRH